MSAEALDSLRRASVGRRDDASDAASRTLGLRRHQTPSSRCRATIAGANVGAADVDGQDGVVASQHPGSARAAPRQSDRPCRDGCEIVFMLDGDVFAGLEQHGRHGPSPARRYGWRSIRRRSAIRSVPSPSPSACSEAGAPRWQARLGEFLDGRMDQCRRPADPRLRPAPCRAWILLRSSRVGVSPNGSSHRARREACRASLPGWRGRRGRWR